MSRKNDRQTAWFSYLSFLRLSAPYYLQRLGAGGRIIFSNILMLLMFDRVAPMSFEVILMKRKLTNGYLSAFCGNVRGFPGRHIPRRRRAHDACRRGQGRAADSAVAEITRRKGRELLDRIDRVIGCIEPALIIVISLIVGFVLLYVMTPLMGIMNAMS